MDLVAEDGIYFSSTGGGITFGGGEPLLHIEFVRAFCQARPAEWNVTIETSLAVPGLKDYPDASYLVDCKSMNPEIYNRYTGGALRIMSENLERLIQEKGPDRIVMRIPRVAGYNDSADQEKSAELLRRMGVR